MKKVMAFDIRQQEAEVKQKIEEISGKLGMDNVEDKLMKSVLENDKDKVDDGKLIEESVNQGIGAFMPDLMYEQLVKDYTMARKIFGERIIQFLTGYDPDYVKKNIRIPEFQREIKSSMHKRVDHMKKEGLLDREGTVTDAGLEMAALVVMLEELDKFLPKGHFGERIHKKIRPDGIRDEIRDFLRGDKYKDISIRKSIKKAIIRNHKVVQTDDLQAYKRKARGSLTVIFALDASSSMKGEKLRQCKRAGLAMAFHATQNRDEVGLIVFGSDVKNFIRPTKDFGLLLKEVISIRATSQTNIRKTIEKGIDMFSDAESAKHLVLITDTKPTDGEEPEQQALKAIAKARSDNISISIVGIELEKDAERLARKMVELGDGRLYLVRDLENIGLAVMEDYLAV